MSMNEVKKSHFQFWPRGWVNFLLSWRNSVVTELLRVFNICLKLFDLKQFSFSTGIENKNMEEKGSILALFQPCRDEDQSPEKPLVYWFIHLTNIYSVPTMCHTLFNALGIQYGQGRLLLSGSLQFRWWQGRLIQKNEG